MELEPSSGEPGLAESPQSLEQHIDTSTCISIGNHHAINKRRDQYFREFKQHLKALWSLQHQKKSPVDAGGDRDEDKEARIVVAIKDTLEKAKMENSRFQDEYMKYDLRAEDCCMYRDFWIPSTMPKTRKLNLDYAKISFGGRNMSFKEATAEFKDDAFGDRGVFRVPSFLAFRDREKLKNGKTKNDLSLHSDEELHELERQRVLNQQQVSTLLGERKAGRAVDKVARILEKWAVRENDNMFIFTQYEYNSYLKNVKSIQVMDKVSGDYDVIAVSEKYAAVFLIQSKGCESGEDAVTIQKKVKEAFVRTMKDKFYFFQCNRDLLHIIYKLTIISLIALPNLTDEDVEEHALCPYHKSIILTDSSLENVDRFADWIQSKVAMSSVESTRQSAAGVFTYESFRELCGRYAGPASGVPSVLTAILKAGKKLQHNFLSLAQKRVCDIDRNLVIISGDTCTGKSLILAAKARQIIKQANYTNVGCNINIVVCTNINESRFCPLDLASDRSSQQMKKLVKNEEGITVRLFEEVQQETAGRDDRAPRFKVDVTPEMFVQTIIEMTREKEGVKQHLLMDEVPFDLIKQSCKILDGAIEDIPVGSNVWLCVSTHTFRVKSSTNEDPRWIRESLPLKFHYEYLDLIKRLPMSLTCVMKEIQRITGDGHGESSKYGHMIMGPKPFLYRVDDCRCQHTADIDYMACSCIEERMFVTFERVFESLKNISRNDIAIKLHNFAYNGTTFENLRQLLTKAFNRLKINLTWSTVLYSSQERERDEEVKSLVVVDARTFSDCEAKILIGVDQCGMFNHFAGEGVGGHKIPMMRCVAQYILVTWPEREAAQNWQKYICEYEMDVSDRTDLTEKQLDYQKDLIRKSVAASYSPSCLEQLLAKDLFKIKLKPGY